MTGQLSSSDGRILDELFAVIEERREGDPQTSWTAKLFTRGTSKIAQKVGEEAVEVVIEGVAGNQQELAEESADLLYHLLVLWADQGLEPTTVWQTLSQRHAVKWSKEGTKG